VYIALIEAHGYGDARRLMSNYIVADADGAGEPDLHRAARCDPWPRCLRDMGDLQIVAAFGRRGMGKGSVAPRTRRTEGRGGFAASAI
jgi:hypothetical protein